MGRLSRSLILIAWALFASVSHAQTLNQCPNGTQPRYSGSSGNCSGYPSPGQAAQCMANLNTTGSAGQYTYSIQSCAVYDTTRYYCSGKRVTNSNGSEAAYNTFITQTCVAGQCALSGGTERTFSTSGSEAPASVCSENCLFQSSVRVSFPGSGGNGGGVFKTEGTSCTTPTAGATQSPSGTLTGAGGHTVGQVQPNTQCGTFNGERICVAQLQNNSCVITSSGNGVCVYGGTTPTKTSPPAPDNGTVGLVATPTATVRDDFNGRLIDYYTQSQVQGSTVQPGIASGPGSGGNGDNDGDGTCEPGETCDPNDEPAEEDEGGDCEEGEDCTASFGDLGDAPTFGESLGTFRTRIAAAPIATALDGLGSAIPTAGTCPTASFAVLDQSFTFDAHCGLLDQFGAQIRLIFIALFALAALLLFFKA